MRMEKRFGSQAKGEGNKLERGSPACWLLREKKIKTGERLREPKNQNQQGGGGWCQ